METKQRERTVTLNDTIYVAYDGREFTCKASCEVYEKSAKCAVRAQLKNITIKAAPADELYCVGGCGMDDILVVAPKTEDDIMRINQYVMLANHDESPKVSNDDIGDVLLLDHYYEDGGVTVLKLSVMVHEITDGAYAIAPSEKKAE